MARLPPTFNFPEADHLDMVTLVDTLNRMYLDLAEAINSKPDIYEREVDGQTDDVFLAQGTINLNTLTKKVEMLTQHIDPSTVTWTQLSN